MRVMRMKAEQRRRDTVMDQQFGRAPRILRRDQMSFAEHAQCTQRDVLQVADGSGDYEERAGRWRHRGGYGLEGGYCTIARMRDPHAPLSGRTACTHRSLFRISSTTISPTSMRCCPARRVWTESIFTTTCSRI